MKKWLGGAALMIVLAGPAPAAAGELRLSIANGRVTLVAQDVTIKQILDEWSRVGQTTIVGAERIVGGPVTIELTDVTEGRALEALLRSASGYIAKPRVGAPGASGYDRILIMPVSRPPALSAAPAPFNRTQPPITMPNIVDDDDEPNPNPIMPPGAAMPPGVPQQPQQYPGQPPMPAQPGMANPQSPTLSRPGQLPPPTGFPGNPNPYQPVQPPVRPPGGGPGGMVPGPGGGGQ